MSKKIIGVTASTPLNPSKVLEALRNELNDIRDDIEAISNALARIQRLENIVLTLDTPCIEVAEAVQSGGYTLTIEHDYINRCQLFINGSKVKDSGDDLSGVYNNVKTVKIIGDDPYGADGIFYTKNDFASDNIDYFSGEPMTWTLDADLTIYAVGDK